MSEEYQTIDDTLTSRREIELHLQGNGGLMAEVDGVITSDAAPYVRDFLNQQHFNRDFLPDNVGKAILAIKDSHLVPCYGQELADRMCSYVAQEMATHEDARTALVVMSDETEQDTRRALHVQKALESQHGIYHVQLVHNAGDALEYMKETHPAEHIDMLFLGQGFDQFGHTVESGKNHEIVTVAVSTNGVRADVKLPDTDSLMDLVWTTGAVQSIYRSNEDAQRYRKQPEDRTLEIPLGGYPR